MDRGHPEVRQVDPPHPATGVARSATHGYLTTHPRATDPARRCSPAGIRAATPTAPATPASSPSAPPTGGADRAVAVLQERSEAGAPGPPGYRCRSRARWASDCTIFGARSRRWRSTTGTTTVRSASGWATPTTPRRSGSTRTGSRTPGRTTCPRRQVGCDGQSGAATAPRDRLGLPYSPREPGQGPTWLARRGWQRRRQEAARSQAAARWGAGLSSALETPP